MMEERRSWSAWSRARRLLACPTCTAQVNACEDHVVCSRGHAFKVELGLVKFSKKSFTDKYDEDVMATRYVQYAFSSQIVRDGAIPDGRSEGLYRTVSDLCRGELISKGYTAPVVVDLACGVGRAIYDIASVHPGALVLGLDLSTVLARCAAAICAGKPFLAAPEKTDGL